MQYLQNCHTIPKAEESVFFFYGNLIGVHHVVIAGEGGNQHYQRAFGKVEICDKAVEHLELIAGVDEYVGEAVAGSDLSVLRRHALKRAAGGRADGDHAAAAGVAAVDQDRLSRLNGGAGGTAFEEGKPRRHKLRIVSLP